MKKLKDYQRPRVNYAYLGDHKALVMTYYGCRLLIDTRNMQHMRIITHGTYEPAVAWAIEENLSAGGRMIDVGTNLGYFTLLGCKIVGGKGHVIGFEANPKIYQMMSSSVFANAFKGRCDTHNNAVFNEQKTFEFTWDSAGHGGGRVITDEGQHRDQNVAEVEAIRLDDFIPADQRTINLIKIDTEGSDPFVIEGAQQLLKSNPGCVVITEWNPKFMAARGYPVERAITMLKNTFSSIEHLKKIGESTAIGADDLAGLNHGNLLLRV
jgi:FkbM family methyltransferase